MFPGVNPRQMKQAMKKMGMAQEEIEALEVVIRLADKDIIVSEPSVVKVKMMGQETFQISGRISVSEHDSTPGISEEDIDTVVGQTGVTREIAEKAILENQGDLASAIMNLKTDE